MKKKQQRKKFTLKRVKRILKNVCKEIGEFFKNLWNRFRNLPNNIRYITYVWLAIVVVIVLIIIAASFNNKHIDSYVAIENDMNVATLEYLKENEVYPLAENKLKLDVNVLIDMNYLSDMDIKENKCEGFSVSYYDDKREDYVVNSYINCKKYTTKYYSDYK